MKHFLLLECGHEVESFVMPGVWNGLEKKRVLTESDERRCYVCERLFGKEQSALRKVLRFSSVWT